MDMKIATAVPDMSEISADKARLLATIVVRTAGSAD